MASPNTRRISSAVTSVSSSTSCMIAAAMTLASSVYSWTMRATRTGCTMYGASSNLRRWLRWAHMPKPSARRTISGRGVAITNVKICPDVVREAS